MNKNGTKSLSLSSRSMILPLTAALVVSCSADAADFTPGTHGFLYSGGSFTQIDVPGADIPNARGINNAGQIVGDFYNSKDPRLTNHGFLYSGGSFTQIDVPGALQTGASGINNAGQIVGAFTPSTGGPDHGFLYSGGSFTQIDVPGAFQTEASGINNAGQIVGAFAPSGGSEHGFLYSGGSFTQIDVPGASQTYAFGINHTGQIVGSTFVSGGAGDPHFTTYSGVAYDFQGIGDFLLTQSNVAGDQFDVQIRLTPWLNGTTIIEGAAATLCGHRVTFDAERARAGAGLISLDGSPILSPAGPPPTVRGSLMLSPGGPALAVGTCKISEPSSEQYRLVWDTGEILDVANYWIHLDLSSQLSAIDGPGSVEGLLATALDPGQWRVSGAASLFDPVPEPFGRLGTRAGWWSAEVGRIKTSPLRPMAGLRPWPPAGFTARNFGVSRPGSAARGFALVDHETAALAAQWLISHYAVRF